MPQSAFLPSSTGRLLAHYSDGDVRFPEHKAFLIGRLFEEGDTRDLRWLTENVTEKELSGWLRVHGGRRLSRRSLAFWVVLLGDDEALAGRPPETEDLWPF
jgi:hypothetical protein